MVKMAAESSANNNNSTSIVRSLNDLPEPILLRIISFLPTTRDAAQTTRSISRKWRKLWLSNPTLRFHNLTWGTQELDILRRFANFVTRTLIRRPPNTPGLLTFDLMLNFTHGVSASQVNSWVRYAVSRGVENLSVTLDAFRRLGISPLGFEFNFRVLRDSRVRIFKLRGCSLFLPPSSVWEPFSSLQSVTLDGVDMTDEMVENIMEGCVNLEVLVLSGVRGCKDIEICSSTIRELTLESLKCEDGSVVIFAPNLSILTVNEFYVGNYDIIDASSIAEAHVDMYEYEYWVEVMRLLENVEHLSTMNWWFELMRSRDIDSGGFVLDNLKYVELGTTYRKSGLIGTSLLLNLSPNLQTLTLDNYSIFDETPEESISDDLIKLFTFNLPSLRQIKMKSFIGMEGEKWLLTVLLKRAVILERIILIPPEGRRGEAPEPPIVLDPQSNSHQDLEYFVSQIPKRRKLGGGGL